MLHHLSISQRRWEAVMAVEGRDEKKGRRKLVEEAVRKVHDASIRAIVANDSRAVEEHFSEAFSSAGGDWQFESRDDFAGGIASGKLQYKSIENLEPKVRVAGANVAVVTGRRSVEAVINGEDFRSTFKNTAVYTLEDNQWKVLLWAVTC
jgi:uncharacterized protein DUF4440